MPRLFDPPDSERYMVCVACWQELNPGSPLPKHVVPERESDRHSWAGFWESCESCGKTKDVSNMCGVPTLPGRTR
jgi:hypothetical protein